MGQLRSQGNRRPLGHLPVVMDGRPLRGPSRVLLAKGNNYWFVFPGTICNTVQLNLLLF